MRWIPKTALQSAREHLQHWEAERALNTDSARGKQCDSYIRQCKVVLSALEAATKRQK